MSHYISDCFSVTIWFKNGESRSFYVVEIYYDEQGVVLRHSDNSTQRVNLNEVVSIHDPTRELCFS